MSKIEVNKEEFLDKYADYVNKINSIGSELTNDCDFGVIKNSSEVVNAFVLAYQDLYFAVYSHDYAYYQEHEAMFIETGINVNNYFDEEGNALMGEIRIEQDNVANSETGEIQPSWTAFYRYVGPNAN